MVTSAGDIVIVLGGPHGLDDTIVNRAEKVISFGRITLPHMLARAVLAEQLYRAFTIIKGEPYHK